MNANLNTEMSEIHGTKCLARWLTSVILAFAIVVVLTPGAARALDCTNVLGFCFDRCERTTTTNASFNRCAGRCTKIAKECDRDNRASGGGTRLDPGPPPPRDPKAGVRTPLGGGILDPGPTRSPQRVTGTPLKTGGASRGGAGRDPTLR